MTSELNIAFISDIHLVHPNTPTEHIIRNLDAAFPDTQETGRLDAIVIAGDLFDRPIHMHDPNAILIKLWMVRFLRICAKHRIEVWVLEGTPSHDWRQSAYLVYLNDLAQIGAQVRYIDTLAIEYSPKLGSILFVPDEWAPETDDTWRQVQQLLQQHGLEQVDFAVMHGSFAYQLPEHVKAPKHDMQRYLGIVRKYINVGHVHKPSQYERILANGSFDRLAHGEEEPKGHWRVQIGPHGDRLTFVENTGAKIYRTIDCNGLSLDAAMEKLSAVAQLPEGSAVRIMAARGETILSSLEVLRKKYPHLTWSTKPVENAVTQTNLLVDLRSTYQQIPLTKSNLRELLMDRIRGLTNDPRVLSRCDECLMEHTR